jgi:hypothetical protein
VVFGVPKKDNIVEAAEPLGKKMTRLREVMDEYSQSRKVDG